MLYGLNCGLMKMDKLNNAIHCFDRTLKIKEQASLDVNCDQNISVTLQSALHSARTFLWLVVYTQPEYCQELQGSLEVT